MKISRIITLSLAVAPLAFSTLAQAKPVLKAPVVRPTAKPLPDAPAMTMNRARAGTGQLTLGSGTFTITSATVVLMPRNKTVEVALDTTRGRLWMSGHATTISSDTVSFTLEHATGSLAESLKLPKRLAGDVTGRVQLAPGKRTFNALTLSGKLQAQAISASFRSAALPTRRK